MALPFQYRRHYQYDSTPQHDHEERTGSNAEYFREYMAAEQRHREIQDAYMARTRSRYGAVAQLSPLSTPDIPGEYEREYRQAARDWQEEGNRLSYQIDIQPQVRLTDLPNYRPKALRWWSLGLLIATLLTCLALIAWASHVLPVAHGWNIMPGTVVENPSVNKRSPPTSLKGHPARQGVGGMDRGWNNGYDWQLIDNEADGAQVAGHGGIPAAAINARTNQEVQRAPPAVHDGRPRLGFRSASVTPTSTAADSVSAPATSTPTKSRPLSKPLDSSTSSGMRPLYPSNTDVLAPNPNGAETVTLSTILGGSVTTVPPNNGATTTPARSGANHAPLQSSTLSQSIGFAPQGSDFGQITTKTLTDGRVTIVVLTMTFVTPAVMMLTDSNGAVTATVTSTPPALSISTLMTLTNSAGVATATQATSILVQPTVMTLTNSVGSPTATMTAYPMFPTTTYMETAVFYIDEFQYFVGLFAPTIIGILITIPVRIIDLNAKLLQPFHELTNPSGASARESLLFRTKGWYGIWSGLRSLAGGRALVFLTTILVISSACLVPLSAEAIAIQLYGTCTEASYKGCVMVLGVFFIPAQVTIALLAFMIVVASLILIFLGRWRSGVAHNPWSIAGIAALSTNTDLRRLFVSLPTGAEWIRHSRLADMLESRKFRLDYFYNHNGVREYGILIHNQAGEPLRRRSVTDSDSDLYKPEVETGLLRRNKIKHHLPFLVLSYTGRVLFLLLACGLLAVILYYNNTGGDTPFENFMDYQPYGVRFLFTAVGVLITFFWFSFSTGLAMISPYQLLASSPQSAHRSILLSPPTNAFSAFWTAIQRRHLFLAVVAATAILSEFIPVLLTNVPFNVTQTLTTHLVCTWMAVGILCIMVLVVVASFFIRWPHMPVDPTTIAGAMYYVCDSWMLWSFDGLSTATKKELDLTVSGLGLMYTFGDVEGISGVRRIGVDAVGGSESRMA